MKLDVAVNEVTLSNTGATGEFKIRNSAKAFKILSDGLYSNKIRAVIRELSCNAVDSHIAANKDNVPFDVHLPNILEPWFSVRDYGIGLSGDQVQNIYTTYFESTKTDSNDYIGALGLGSKSPFSYTENFTVTAIKAGIKRIYSAYINEMGVPSITEMSEELTDEGNGVEVKFSVVNRHDYYSFRYEAQNVFTWFKIKPNVTGVDRWEINTPEYKEKDIVPGVHYRSSRDSIAVMGNISYPIKISEPQKHFGELSTLLGCGLVMEFAIGELDFAASREELSYVPLTISSIKKKLEELNVNLATHLAAKADAIPNEWNRAEYLSEQLRSDLYKSAVHKYVTDTKFELIDLTNYRGHFDFKYKVDDLAARGLEVNSFRLRVVGSSTLKPSSEYIGNNYVKSWYFTVESGSVFVLNDLKTGCVARARYHFNQVNPNGSVYCITHSNPDLKVRQAEYNKFLLELHTPPTVIKASELMKQERKKAVSTQGIMIARKKENSCGNNEGGYCWKPYSDTLKDNETYYYVSLHNYDSFNERNESIRALSLRRLMEKSGIKEITNIQLFGVRKNRIKELKGLSNWVPFEAKLKEEIDKISDKHIASLVAAEMLDSYYNRVYSNKNVAKLAGKDSPYSIFVRDVVDIPQAKGNVSALVALCAEYGKSMQVDAVKKKFTDAKAALYKRYPLLEHCFHANAEDVAAYIKMTDKQEKT